jgi:hypothetical protein
MSETSERPWVKGDRFTINGRSDHVYEVGIGGTSVVEFINLASHWDAIDTKLITRVDPPEPVGELLETERAGKRWREVGWSTDFSELTVRFEPVPLNLDDLAAITYENTVTWPRGWATLTDEVRDAWRAGTAAVLDAVGHVLPEQEEGPR